ncbi:MAG: thrombospondin type 3 repeat-containing protein [Burkholderiaceae bacterium]
MNKGKEAYVGAVDRLSQATNAAQCWLQHQTLQCHNRITVIVSATRNQREYRTGYPTDSLRQPEPQAMTQKQERASSKAWHPLRHTAIAVAIGILLAACGDTDSTTQVVSQSGTAIDGYLGNAQVCLDLNNDGACTDGEPESTTDANGNFTLEATPAQFTSHSILVVAIAGQTIDSDTPGTPVTQGFKLSAPPGLTNAAGNSIVTPITTVLDKERAQTPDKSTEDIIATSPTANTLCGHMGETADVKACVTADHVENATSSDTLTRVTAQRKQLVARVLTRVIADAEGKAAADPLGETTAAKRSLDAALVNRSLSIVEKVDDALMNAEGDAQSVDTNAIATRNSLLGSGGLKSLVNSSQTTSTSVAANKVFETNHHRYKLAGTSLTRDSVTRGHYYGFGAWNSEGYSYTENAGFNGTDFSEKASNYDSSAISINAYGEHYKLHQTNLAYDSVRAVFARNAKRLQLADRSVAGLLDQHAPGKDRSWHDVLTSCTKFGADAVGHLVRIGAGLPIVRVPAFAFYGVLPESVIPAITESTKNIDRHSPPIDTVIANFNASQGSFTVLVGPELAVALADGTATFKDRQSGAVLGQTPYEYDHIKAYLGLAKVVKITNLDVIGDRKLYFSPVPGDALGIAVAINRSLSIYKPRQTFGTLGAGYGVGVFALHERLVERLFLNDAAATQLEQALDADALAAGTKQTVTDCPYAVDTGNPSQAGTESEETNDDNTTTDPNPNPDSDGDGVPDATDRFPNDPTESTDLDNDGIGDNADTDRDGDNVNNDVDAFPNEPGESSDLDGDGIGDNADTDRDGDNIANDLDAFPGDPSEWADTDGDGVGNNTDAFPSNPNETMDTDMDGVGDNSDPAPLNPEIPNGPGGGSEPLCDPSDPTYPFCI